MILSENRDYLVRFQVLTATSMAVFWVVAQYSLVGIYRLFRAITLTMEAASTSEMSANLYQTIRRNNPSSAIISSNSINQLMFVMGKYCVFFEVPPLLPYVCMAWYLIKHQEQLYLHKTRGKIVLYILIIAILET
jgi:hypothetical protein